MAKQKRFHVQAKITLYTALPVLADTLEDAVRLGRECAVNDFVTIKGEHQDDTVEITGVYS